MKRNIKFNQRRTYWTIGDVWSQFVQQPTFRNLKPKLGQPQNEIIKIENGVTWVPSPHPWNSWEHICSAFRG